MIPEDKETVSCGRFLPFVRRPPTSTLTGDHLTPAQPAALHCRHAVPTIPVRNSGEKVIFTLYIPRHCVLLSHLESWRGEQAA